MRIAHVVPDMSIGGVEVAVARSHARLNEKFDYRVFYVRRPGVLDVGQCSVFTLFRAALTGKWRPDVVVTSLWPSHPYGVLLRLLGVVWVAFFHSSGFSGRLQKAIHVFSWRHARLRLVDSNATGAALRAISDRDYHVVPYLFADPASGRDWLSRHYDCVWLGRPAAVKRTDLVASLMRELASRHHQGRLCLIVAGNVPVEFAELDLGPGWQIDIHRSLGRDDVRRLLEDSRFFVLTSEREGMSMSTVEAVSAGCVPVVTLVGELKTYIGQDYELALTGHGPVELTVAARAVSDRWTDASFATVAVEGIRRRLADYSTYEQAFLSAIRLLPRRDR